MKLPYAIKHPDHGRMVFIPQGDFSKDRCQSIPDNVVVRICYYDGASHKSLTHGWKTSEDQRTGIKRARKIWDDKINEGWFMTMNIEADFHENSAG